MDFFKEKKEIRVLELGFGTGLNALITMFESEIRKQNVFFTGVEKYPVDIKEILELNYSEQLLPKYKSLSTQEDQWKQKFHDLYEGEWEQNFQISNYFHLTKTKQDFLDLNFNKNSFDIVYFDCFGARVQPELWTEKLFGLTYKFLKVGGVLTTYSSKGSARRAMEAVGFRTKKVEGPPGKREMLIAWK